MGEGSCGPVYAKYKYASFMHLHLFLEVAVSSIYSTEYEPPRDALWEHDPVICVGSATNSVFLGIREAQQHIQGPKSCSKDSNFA